MHTRALKVVFEYLLTEPTVFALSPECMISGEATNTKIVVFGLTQTIYRTRGEYADHSTGYAGVKSGTVVAALAQKRETKRVCLAQSEHHHHLIQCLADETAHLADGRTITMNI
jgi:hypothetical protein